MSPSSPRKTRRPTPDRRPPSATAVDLPAVEAALHAVTRRTAPGLRQVRKWEVDWYAGTDLVLCIGAFSRHVGVEFWRGSTLAPDHPLLEGTGKNLRHVKVRSLEEARSPEFRALVRAAVRLDRTAPARVR